MKKESLNSSTRIVGVQSEVQLPPIWSQLANAKRYSLLNILRHAIDGEKSECAEPEIQFIATAPLLQMIQLLAFEMSSMDNISSDLQQPFLFPEQNPEDAAKGLFAYESLYSSGGAAPSSDDITALIKAKVSPPLENLDAHHMCGP